MATTPMELINMWKDILKDSNEIESEVIETLKQVYEAAQNQWLSEEGEDYHDNKENLLGTDAWTKRNKGGYGRVPPRPKYLLVIAKALNELGYDIESEMKAETHKYSDVNTFKEIRQYS